MFYIMLYISINSTANDVRRMLCFENNLFIFRGIYFEKEILKGTRI